METTTTTTQTNLELECSDCQACDHDEYVPCENHAEIVYQRDGANSRSADELTLQLIEDITELTGTSTPWGRNVIDQASNSDAWEGHWLESPGLRDELETLAYQLESDLATADGNYVLWQSEGYVIFKLTGGPLLAAD